MRAVLLNVGDEVLCGKVVNTNASFLAMELEKIGIDVVKVITVGDDKDDLIYEIDNFINSKNDLLITTGGLGPTHDDFTKEVLYERLNVEVEAKEEALELLNKYFKGSFTDCNLKQIYYPKECIMLPNDMGTAMGSYNEKDGKMYAVLVGPPFELKPMFLNYLVPVLKQKTKCEKLINEYIIMGTGESQIEDILKDYYKKYPNVEINPYASVGKVRFQITSDVAHKDEFESASTEFQTILNDYIISNTNENIEDVVLKQLLRLNYKISFTESCTGGMLASKIINCPNASKVLEKSFVTYSDQSKIDILNVNETTINKFDVVSEEVAREMVEGLYKVTNADVCVSSTGYCGPSGGTDKIKVGTVCYAIKVHDKVYSYTSYFKTQRNIVREKATMLIYYYIYKALKSI